MRVTDSHQPLGEFAKSRKAPVCFVKPVALFVRVYQHGSQWADIGDFYEYHSIKSKFGDKQQKFRALLKKT